jgi:1-acyl-sn-glycerol-3-phosphate acyltransferase
VSRLFGLLARLGPRRFGRDPGAFDPAAVERTVAALARAGRRAPLFPVDARGLERVPPPPALLVMNHSGGTSIPDVWGFLYAWYRRFGGARPLHTLAHELVVGQPLTGPWCERRGVLLAEPGIARRVLVDERRDVLVLPGGDREAWRPFRDRHRVDFGGRLGYARLALETGVPVVPVAHDGAHRTLLVLARGGSIARALGLHRLARADIWPLHLSLPWGIALGPLPHLPLPVALRYAIGDPVEAPTVIALDAAVRAAIQELLDGLAGGAPNWRDRLRRLRAAYGV